MHLMDTVCLWTGRIVILAFGIGGATWLASIPFEYAFRKMNANLEFSKWIISKRKK